jgi:hypothetical protein
MLDQHDESDLRITPEQLRTYRAFVRSVGVELADKMLPHVGKFLRNLALQRGQTRTEERD